MGGQGPHLRVFLSADLVGSTKLKNELNQQLLRERYEIRLHLIDRLRALQPGLELDEQTARRAVLQSLGLGTEDLDWATVVESFYRDFHNQFAAQLRDSKPKLAQVEEECRPWKAIGDELLYQIPVSSRQHLYRVVVCFLKALRRSDNKVIQEDRASRGLRIKGTAWVAGFPVRNRVVKLPAVDLHDFLGPDIDTGFRIGRCTRPGMLAVSVDLAELLAETPDFDPFLGMIVGWESLKGVWNDSLYPVVWVDLPGGIQETAPELQSRPFNDWQRQECRFCRAWEEEKPKRQLRELAERLRDLRKQLPPDLGLVDPYIAGEGDEIPLQHRQIHELQTLIEQYLEEAGQQGAEEDVAGRAGIPKEQVEKLVSDVLSQPSDEQSDEVK